MLNDDAEKSIKKDYNSLLSYITAVRKSYELMHTVKAEKQIERVIFCS